MIPDRREATNSARERRNDGHLRAPASASSLQWGAPEVVMNAAKKWKNLGGGLAFGITGILLAPSAEAANFPLELAHPRAAGTSPTPGAPTIDPSHRIFWAYPGLAYDVRAVVTGGAYPYAFSLTNAPTGMTIDAATGRIHWPNPQATAADVGLTVVDAEGTQVQSTWTITVDPTKFLFVDAVRGHHAPSNGCSATCGTGTLENPWQTISDMVSSGSGSAGKILYFRAGTYGVLDVPRARVGGPWERVELSSTTRALSWIAYPGETPIVDFGFDGAAEPGPLIRLSGPAVYIDGFETRRSHYIAWQLGQAHYGVLRRMRMHEHGPGEDGTNAAFIMTLTQAGETTKYLAIQNNDFSDYDTSVAIKFYSQEKAVIEDNAFHDDHASEAIHLKADSRQFLVQHNLFFNMSGSAIAGNMHDPTTGGEVRFNVVRDSPIDALGVNQDGMATTVYAYRNTFVGRVRVRNTDGADGPFHFRDNVIVSSTPEGACVPGSRIYCENVSDSSRVMVAAAPHEDLDCAPGDGCTDAMGLLQGTARTTYLGLKGHELVNHPAPGENTGPSSSAPDGGTGERRTDGGPAAGAASDVPSPSAGGSDARDAAGAEASGCSVGPSGTGAAMPALLLGGLTLLLGSLRRTAARGGPLSSSRRCAR